MKNRCFITSIFVAKLHLMDMITFNYLSNMFRNLNRSQNPNILAHYVLLCLVDFVIIEITLGNK